MMAAADETSRARMLVLDRDIIQLAPYTKPLSSKGVVVNTLEGAAPKAIEYTSITQHPVLPILNEAVNFEKKCIFIAVPKTGTSPVRIQLKQQGGALIPNPHLNIIQVRDSLYVYFLKLALGNNMAFPSDSAISDADIRAKSKAVFDSYFKFSAVRNPWARAVSLYSRLEGIQTRDSISFDAFCKNHMYASDTCRHPTLHQTQLDWLCDESGKIIMDYVYKLEDFDLAIREIAERTNGRVQLENTIANKNPHSNADSYRALYTDETRKLIAKRFERDIDTFKYVF